MRLVNSSQGTSFEAVLLRSYIHVLSLGTWWRGYVQHRQILFYWKIIQNHANAPSMLFLMLIQKVWDGARSFSRLVRPLIVSTGRWLTTCCSEK